MKNRIALLSCIIVIAGCSTITDLHTQPTIEYIEPQEHMIVYDHRSDNMDRGEQHYYKKEIVIDPEYYKTNGIMRGDVIYFRYPKSLESRDIYGKPMDISRIVGLPNETIEVKKGQIYIDGKKLETFYGEAKNNIYNSAMFKNGDIEGHDMEKQVVPDGYVIIIGDAWWRSIDSQQFGALPIENIKGKVLGYKK
jgi:signal peptidase I